ncbi:MAG TPA: FixH family protein [Steroidobacteraceae bacterium]|nr:FixH family protein [Steroidobacteraceae bacterium]
MTNTAPHPSPWYREPWPWILISLPASAVVAGIATVWIAATSADGLVVGDYYKAGLAINQTLARDEAARALALSATLTQEAGALSLQLGGNLQAYPARLTLTLAHPTRQGMDHVLTLQHVGGGRYRTALPAMQPGKWHAQLTDPASAWRLSGVLHTPLNRPVTLAASNP